MQNLDQNSMQINKQSIQGMGGVMPRSNLIHSIPPWGQ